MKQRLFATSLKSSSKRHNKCYNAVLPVRRVERMDTMMTYNTPEGYNPYDYKKVVAFLELTDEEEIRRIKNERILYRPPNFYKNRAYILNNYYGFLPR